MSTNTSASASLEIKNGIAILHLGSPDEKAIILNQSRVSKIEALIEEVDNKLKKDPHSLKGLIITSPTHLNFCVGADIHAIKDITDPEKGAELARQGQKVFQKVEDLTIPVVAAIHGHCVGGGCELALACDYRIMSDDKTSKIGLPETKLGILPGFGGTQRLPKVIGLPKSLDIILGGKIVPAKKAKSLGLIDAIVNNSSKIGDELIDEAIKHLSLGKRKQFSYPLSDTFLTKTLIGRMICEKSARKSAFKKTKGHYPAIPKSIESVMNGFKFTSELAYQKEAAALGELIISPESKSLVHIFFLTESASKLGKQDAGKPIASLALIGAGIMGRGIAAVAIKSGIIVNCFDPADKARNALSEHVSKFIDKSRSINSKDKENLLKNLTLADSLNTLPISDLYIEAAIEKLEIKKEIFSTIASNKTEESILASNTSSLSLKDIFDSVSHPDRCIGIHFFNPVEKMPLIELVRTDKTSPKTLIKASHLCSKLGKYPVIVEDVPGFLVNRVLSPFLAEASQLLKDGASFRAIEKVATSFGFPMGPFRLLDEVGLDIAEKVEETLSNAYGDRMSGGGYLNQIVKEGFLGKKNGKGFYVHEGKNSSPNSSLLEKLGVSLDSSSINNNEIENRLVLSMLNEAIKAFDEGVAGTPSKEAAEQIDLASIMGFGFPPFRGGILYFARKTGISNIRETMKSFEKSSARFKPAESISKGSITGY